MVAYQQDLHFRQLFKVLELMGYDWYSKDCEHVAFGMVSFEGQTLSTREGRIVYLEDLLNTSIQKARAIIEEKSPDLENKDEVARSRSALARWCSSLCTTTGSRTLISGGIAR